MPQQPNPWFVGHIHCSDKLVRARPDHTTRFPNYVTLREYTQTANEYEQWRYLLNPCRIRFGLMLIELCVQLAANGDFKLKLIPTTRLVCTACSDCATVYRKQWHYIYFKIISITYHNRKHNCWREIKNEQNLFLFKMSAVF